MTRFALSADKYIGFDRNPAKPPALACGQQNGAVGLYGPAATRWLHGLSCAGWRWPRLGDGGLRLRAAAGQGRRGLGAGWVES